MLPNWFFSALDASVAGEIEQAFASAGHFIVSNSGNHRMLADVPLLIPEINADHLGLIPTQRKNRGWSGAIVTNPNCSTITLAMALAPLKPFGIRKILATTMQAVSGAGYPGLPSMDILGNVIPHIGGEEEKMEQETQKILGNFNADKVEHLPAEMSAHCNRVGVVDGHMVAVSVELEQSPGVEGLLDAFASFRGVPQEKKPAHCTPTTRSRDGAAESAAAPQRSVDGARDGCLRGPSPRVPGARLQVCCLGPQHDPRRRRRGRAQRRAAAQRGFIGLRPGGKSAI